MNKMKGAIGRALGWHKPQLGSKEEETGPDPRAGPGGQEKPTQQAEAGGQSAGACISPGGRGSGPQGLCEARGDLEFFLWELESVDWRVWDWRGPRGETS